METGRPSRTALGAAVHRAAHQVFDEGRIFPDPLALAILDAEGRELVQAANEEPARRVLRAFIAVRTRFAEDALHLAVDRGVRQLVILGAGLDTYAYRSTLGAQLRIFEVDYPATQTWKRARLSDAGISIPSNLTFTGVDFEREILAERLAVSGFDASVPTFFTWLGVVPYLTDAAVFATLSYVAGLQGGAHVVFDYSNPPAALGTEGRAAHDALTARVAAVGESFKSFFETDALLARLSAIGFREVEDLGPREIAARYLPQSTGKARGVGGHIVRATTMPASA